MKIKIFATKYANPVDIANALNKARTYFSSFPLEFSDIFVLPERDDNPRMYEVKWAETFKTLSLVKLISDSYFQTLDIAGYDGALIFLDKNMAIESVNTYGQETQIRGLPYGAVFLSNKYVKFSKTGNEYGEWYQDDPSSELGDANSHAVIHELFHAFCIKYGIWDFLHQIISEGHFDSFKTYLLNNLQKMQPSNSQALYKATLARLGTDVTPKDEVPDNVACAATVSALLSLVVPFTMIAGTYALESFLSKDACFKRVSTPEQGSILVYPTGTGNGKLSNGHTFICDAFNGDNTKLYSNDSATGLLKQNYTLKTARARYVTLGGFSETFFTLI